MPYPKSERSAAQIVAAATRVLAAKGYARTSLLDIAREAGMEPIDVRLANVVRPEEMPYDNITKKHFDSGDYPRVLKMARDAIRLAEVRARMLSITDAMESSILMGCNGRTVGRSGRPVLEGP